MAVAAALSAYLQDFALDRFFEAHEDLEGLWWARDSDPFLQGLILFAAAFVKVQRRNAAGARRHFAACVRYLGPYAPAHLGVDVAAVIAAAQAAMAALEAVAPAGSLTDDALGSVVPRFHFTLLAGAEAEWDRTPAPATRPDLAGAIAVALADRATRGLPVGPSSWGEVVKEVARRTGGRVPRGVLREAVRRALDGRT